MLALAEIEGSACPGCGGHLPDTTSSLYEQSAPSTRCHRCTALAVINDALTRTEDTAGNKMVPAEHPHAMFHHVRPVTNQRRAAEEVLGRG